MTLEEILSQIGPTDAAAAEKAQQRLDRLTKPQGSLGRLEVLARWLASVTGTFPLSIERPVVFTFAADHGVAAEGVSAYPQEVTAQMVLNFLAGGAAINALAKQAGADVVVADFGVAGDLKPAPGLIDVKIARGTANMAQGPAMSREQALRAIIEGARIALAAKENGAGLFALGEMGIGNSTAASALTAALTGASPEEVTGRGTGVDADGLKKKIEVIRRALAFRKLNPADPISILAQVGGFEIAGLVGVVLAGAATRTPVLVDGFIASAAALVACRIAPDAVHYLSASHMSVERGHQRLLRELGLTVLFDFGMRLGEGTGAALAIPILRASCAVYNEMATFDQAGVAEKTTDKEPSHV
ncbi:MAG: nicotinate-nucleotide--dimethylbenzimidazole phosphoribosyltransferase [Elusimicrobia bacterium]|nr:nicotinate-nucleotide--dimethylbenzimidazole phosphoribosyltransferase [Elusimicrobiota bacterium]